ncbi:MAG: segregation/condensation protein A [Lachnospiraceae bacterium]|nr:segregation/condensation protein A [Lachnospiraceae bacterium]MBP3610463.1 segregation/condensation protein A [Lachnospiraceae bacterium]
MAIPVKLEVFEGPLDLLLHLIDKNKINIYDIPIALITEQYMAYLEELEKQDLDNMSEFLVMAATLLRIKSKMLLPQEETEEEEPEDPRQELVERLLEYKMYKFASLELRDRQLEADKMFFKKSTLPPEVKDYKEEVNLEELLSGLTLAKLNDIFRSVIKKQADKIDPVRSKFGKIEKEEVNLSEKMRYVQEYGLLYKTFSFRGLLEEQADKMEVIVTFLCILELMKMGRIHIVQEEIFDDIFIEYLAEDVIEIEETQL